MDSRLELEQAERERDEARAYAQSRLATHDRMAQQLEHRTLTLGAAVKRAEAAEAELAALKEQNSALRQAVACGMDDYHLTACAYCRNVLDSLGVVRGEG